MRRVEFQRRIRLEAGAHELDTQAMLAIPMRLSARRFDELEAGAAASARPAQTTVIPAVLRSRLSNVHVVSQPERELRRAIKEPAKSPAPSS